MKSCGCISNISQSSPWQDIQGLYFDLNLGADLDSCSICKAGLKNPSGMAGYWCDNGEGASLGDSNGHPDGPDKQLAGDESSCLSQGGTWKPYSCQDLQDFWYTNYQNGLYA